MKGGKKGILYPFKGFYKQAKNATKGIFCLLAILSVFSFKVLLH